MFQAFNGGKKGGRVRRDRRPKPGGRARALGLERMEDRSLLAHMAPVLNPADAPYFAPIGENAPIASNTGESVQAMLATGGGNFIAYDTSDGGIAGGIAITSVGSEAGGVWQDSINGGSSWTLLAPSVSSANAVALKPNDLVRFLPNDGFTGTVSLQLVAWDQSDGLADGSRVDLTLPGATGGGTAYSSAAATATLAVTPTVGPSFSLISTSTAEDNTQAASGGTPSGSNPNVISVPNFASNITLGDGGGNAVSFNVTDAGGNFGTLFKQAPAIDSQGTLTYQLNPDQYGIANLDVTAVNGVASSVKQTTISVTQINDPPTLNAIASPGWVRDTAGQQTIALSGISGGYDEPYDGVTVRAAASAQSGDNASLIYNLGTTYGGGGTGGVYYTPTPGQNGTLHVTVTVTDSGALTAKQTFVVTVYSAPSFSLSTTNISVANTAGAQTVPNLATSIQPGYPNTSGNLYITVSNNNNGLFSAQPYVSSSGTLTYTPAAGQHGAATVSVTLSNSMTGLSSTQSLSLNVVAAATANPEIYVVGASGGSAAAAPGVLGNDTNPNSGWAMTPGITSTPAYGSLSLNTDGSFTYTPNGSFQGIDHFTYVDVVGPTTSNAVTDTVYSHGGALVAKMYQQMLKRAAGDSDVKGWAPSVDANTANIQGVDQGVYNSNEYESPKITNWFYSLLGRGPSASDLSYWENIWTQYESPEAVINGIASTAESFNYAQTQYHYSDANSNWVSLIYPAILNRAVDSGALSYFTGELDNHYMTQGQVAQALTSSNEYRDGVIQSFFQTFLGRSASSSDLNYYQGLMDNYGYTQLHVQQVIVGSGEYLGNPPAASAGTAALWAGPSGY